MSLTSGESPTAPATWRSAALATSSPFGFHRPPALEGRKKARRDLRVFGVEIEHNVRDKIVAAAVFRVELGRIHGGEGADERAHPVRVVKRESLVFHEGFHPVERAAFGDRRLQGKPFVDDERFAFMGAVEGIERGFAFALQGYARARRARRSRPSWWWRLRADAWRAARLRSYRRRRKDRARHCAKPAARRHLRPANRVRSGPAARRPRAIFP